MFRLYNYLHDKSYSVDLNVRGRMNNTSHELKNYKEPVIGHSDSGINQVDNERAVLSKPRGGSLPDYNVCF